VKKVGVNGGIWMPKAYVLINTEPGLEAEVLEDLQKMAGVDEAYFSYGVYDIIAKVQAESMDELKGLVTRRIRLLHRVKSTLTLIITEE
jgi:DNA-binding Lrp family transcriptional regulator